jgi:hypothetical protein
VTSRRCARRSCGGLRLGATLVALLLCGIAAAQAADPEGHRGEMSLSYQYSEARDLIGAHLTIPTTPLYTRLVDFAVDYELNDRWSVSAGLPLISRKVFDPNRTHDPLGIVPPRTESEFIDDGEFHTYWQDLRLEARYRALTEPFIVEPYFEYSLPMSDYPFFANGAVGQRLKRQEYGATLAYRPPFLQWYFSLRAGYANAPSTLGVSIDGVRVDGQAIRFLSPRIALRVFFSSKHNKGMLVPSTPIDRTSQLWYYHDRMIRHNYISAGLGADIALGNRNSLGVDWIKMPHAQDVFQLQKAFNISVSRSFGSPTPSSGAKRIRLPASND